MKMAPAHPRVAALLEVLLCSSLPTQLVLQFALVGLGLDPLTDAGMPALTFVVTLLLTDTIVLVALMVIISRAHGDRVSDLWLGQRPVAREALLGLSFIPAIFLLVVVLLSGMRLIAPWLHNVPDNPLEALASGGTRDAILFGLVAIIAGGVREELQRAFLLTRFERHLGGTTVGVIVLSVAFGLGHVLQGWDAGIATALMGLMWALMYVRRRSSVAPVVSHAGFNSLEIVRIAVGDLSD
jgi:membrane protease YdiL (CAAX protease family)